MSLDCSIQFFVGITGKSLCKGNPVGRTVDVKKFNEDTGEPYMTKKPKHFLQLKNGVDIEVEKGNFCDFSYYPLNEYCEKFNLSSVGIDGDLANGIIGKEIGKHVSMDGCRTTSLQAPPYSEIQFLVVEVKELFKSAGFPADIIDLVSLHVVMVASC